MCRAVLSFGLQSKMFITYTIPRTSEQNLFIKLGASYSSTDLPITMPSQLKLLERLVYENLLGTSKVAVMSGVADLLLTLIIYSISGVLSIWYGITFELYRVLNY